MGMVDGRPKVWAHRGWSSRYPENTLAAFQSALTLGVDGLELDVHLTQDQQIVVLHDARLERTTNGTGTVHEHTLETLKQLDAGAWFHPSFAGTGIPTLSEVLALICGHQAPVELNIEIKVGDTVYEDLESMVWEQILDFGLQRQVLISSFHHGILRKLKQRYPSARIALLCDHLGTDPWVHAAEMRAEAIHPNFTMLDQQQVASLQEHGLAVHVWTVDQMNDIERMQMFQVDAIITNHPERMLLTSTPGAESR